MLSKNLKKKFSFAEGIRRKHQQVLASMKTSFTLDWMYTEAQFARTSCPTKKEFSKIKSSSTSSIFQTFYHHSLQCMRTTNSLKIVLMQNIKIHRGS